MNIEAYLDRLNYQEETDNSVETLRKLHRAHVYAVPFENLNIHNDVWIELNPQQFFNKIVRNKRGGFCYEMNGLFYEALQRLGFECHFISCSVFFHPIQQFAPYFGHVAIIVKDGDDLWLTDVGFGSSFLEPLKIVYDELQTQDGNLYRFTKLDHDEILLERSEDGMAFLTMYKFTLTPRKLENFQEMCVFHQTSPLSPFTRRKICSLVRPNGRITLTSQSLVITKNGKKTETSIADDQEFKQKLLEYFALDENKL